MIVLRCPVCGTFPANEATASTGRDSAGFTTVERIVMCPSCGNTLIGDPDGSAFHQALASWKVDRADLPDE